MPLARKILAELREKAGLSPSAMARALEMPLTSYLHYETRFKDERLPMELGLKVAAALRSTGHVTENQITQLVPPLELGLQAPRAAQPADEFNLSTATVTKVPSNPITPSIPLYASAQGGLEGSMVIDNSPIGSVLRPNAVAQARDAYAVYVVGSSMAPRFEQGDVAIVNPHKPPAGGDDILLVRVEADGTRYALLKRLISFNDKVWRVRQYEPAKDFQLPRETWAQAHCVVGRENGR